jgi:hypothetical protein
MKKIIAPPPSMLLEQILETVCVFCGCSESNACETPEGPCHWAFVSREDRAGVCSACAITPLAELVRRAA